MKYQLLPNLTADEYDALRTDIRERGVMVPVELDETGTILDGHHRAAIAEELGIDYPTIVRAGLNEEQKVGHVLALNLHRRQLTREQRAELVADLRRRRMSLRKIAEVTGIPRSTVERDLSPVPNGTPDEIAGADGKVYPSRRPAPEPPLDPTFERESSRDLEITPAHAAKYPHLALADLRVQYTDALYSFGRPGKFEPEEWADRVAQLPAEDIARIRQHLAYVRRWLDKWDRLLGRPALSLVGGTPE